MTTKSNDQGRALEFAICTKILESFPGSKLTDRATKDNVRDAQHYKMLAPKKQADFSKCAAIVLKWIFGKVGDSHASLLIDRLPDVSGVESDSTDIKIIFETGRVLNLSIKNAYPALKHQRLPRLPAQCGIKEPKIIAQYARKHDRIWSTYYSKINIHNSNAKKFSEVQQITFDSLYAPLKALVISFLNENGAAAPEFFRFITGKHGFYMIKNSRKTVSIFDFSNFQSPTKMHAKSVKKNTLLVTFDNGWNINLRLHTASSKLFTSNGSQNRSLKMDTTLPSIDKLLKPEVFEKEG